MRYFVVDPHSGQKFGPADLELLGRWAAEGRLTAHSTLEDVATGQRVYAAEIPGLRVNEVAPPMPGGSGPYEAPPQAYVPVDEAQKEANAAWIWFAVGLACCGLFGYPMSIIAANRAEALGNQNAKVAKILSIIFLVLSTLGLILFVIGLANS